MARSKCVPYKLDGGYGLGLLAWVCCQSLSSLTQSPKHPTPTNLHPSYLNTLSLNPDTHDGLQESHLHLAQDSSALRWLGWRVCGGCKSHQVHSPAQP
eukprot:5223222-Amphidinium_carterae.1